MSRPPPDPGDPADDPAGPTQAVRAQLRLRELIVGGRVAPGDRIAELAMVQLLGMAHAPIRAALARLHEEGLLETAHGGGYLVRAFSEDDVLDAIELRGTAEGLAARMAAERGVPAALWVEVNDCLDRLDELLAPPSLTESSFARYVEYNGQFHGLLAEMSGSALVQRQVERLSDLPFASPSAFVLAHATGPRARDRLIVAQDQHRALVEAIEAGEGARAEALAREHARHAHRNLDAVLRNQKSLRKVSGFLLSRRPTPR
jgi:GntR family transcriptional regulator, vanillate catabolism transcriptional regulator